jgi:5-methylcytosine-specific restriction protein A
MTLRTLPPRIRTVDTSIARTLPKVADQFYLSPEWRALMARLIAERGRRCQDCGRTDCRIFGDHVHELKDGGEPLDPANVRLLCGSCHSAKTNRARAERMARPAPTPSP